MGQSVKILAPNKRVMMPKIACCAMARMIDVEYYNQNIQLLENAGIAKEDILPVTYINSSAEVKAAVGKMGGFVCTSSNAKKIITKAVESGKKILFVPDRCLGQNIAKEMGLKSCAVGMAAILKWLILSAITAFVLFINFLMLKTSRFIVQSIRGF